VYITKKKLGPLREKIFHSQFGLLMAFLPLLLEAHFFKRPDESLKMLYV